MISLPTSRVRLLFTSQPLGQLHLGQEGHLHGVKRLPILRNIHSPPVTTMKIDFDILAVLDSLTNETTYFTPPRSEKMMLTTPGLRTVRRSS